MVNMVNQKNIKGCILLFLLAGIIIFLIWFFVAGDKKDASTPDNPPTQIYDAETMEKLNRLDNIQDQIDYFEMDYLDRYVAYKDAHPELDSKTVVIYVNAGLDYDFYTHTATSSYLNTPYIIANKHYALGSDYVPENLVQLSSKYGTGKNNQMVQVAKDAFESLCKAAEDQGYTIRGISGYRSYEYQEELYNNYVLQDGKDEADTYSSRAGHSDHQTGLAIDVSDGDTPYTSFGETDEFRWMQDNAYLYGFILRFPKGKENITGYQYESWHYRYVGVDIATYIHENNVTFEEYYEMFVSNKK